MKRFQRQIRLPTPCPANEPAGGDIIFQCVALPSFIVECTYYTVRTRSSPSWPGAADALVSCGWAAPVHSDSSRHEPFLEVCAESDYTTVQCARVHAGISRRGIWTSSRYAPPATGVPSELGTGSGPARQHCPGSGAACRVCPVRTPPRRKSRNRIRTLCVLCRHVLCLYTGSRPASVSYPPRAEADNDFETASVNN